MSKKDGVFPQNINSDDFVTVIPDPEGKEPTLGGLPDILPDDNDLSNLSDNIGTEDDFVAEVPDNSFSDAGDLVAGEEYIVPDGETASAVKEESAEPEVDVFMTPPPVPSSELVWSDKETVNEATEEKTEEKIEPLPDIPKTPEPKLEIVKQEVPAEKEKSKLEIKEAEEPIENDETEFYITPQQRVPDQGGFSDTIDIPLILSRRKEETSSHEKAKVVKPPKKRTEKKEEIPVAKAVKAPVKHAAAKKTSEAKASAAVKVEKNVKPEKKEASLPVAIKRKRFSLFYVIYFALIVLFLIALLIAAKVINSKLADYEASRPYNYVDKVMREYFEPGDAEALVTVSGYEKNEYEKRGEVLSLVESFLNKDPEYYSVATSDGSMKYAVRAGDLKFAEITMKSSGEKDAAGYDVLALDKIDLMIAGAEAVSITAPEGYRVFLNSIELDSSLITDTVEAERDAHLPEDIPAVKYVTYVVKGLIAKPAVTAIDKYGNPVEEIGNDNDIFFDIPITYANVTEEVKERALAAGEALAAYMQLDAPFNRIGQYVDPASDLYYDLMTSDVKWANDHNGYAIDHPTVTEYSIWSDDVYSVRVRFTHILYNWGGNFENEFDTTFYYKWNGVKWQIYDSQVN